ncbi:hypothetical protein BJP08_07890 [Corynebacterium sp. NML140438]|nr:hypothetical protein BJP08_07890 [Corynebacterium sp. NML140438]
MIASYVWTVIKRWTVWLADTLEHLVTPDSIAPQYAKSPQKNYPCSPTGPILARYSGGGLLVFGASLYVVGALLYTVMIGADFVTAF